MTRCESYPPCFRTIYFPTAPQEMLLKYCLDLSYIQNGNYLFLHVISFLLCSCVFHLPLTYFALTVQRKLSFCYIDAG